LSKSGRRRRLTQRPSLQVGNGMAPSLLDVIHSPTANCWMPNPHEGQGGVLDSCKDRESFCEYGVESGRYGRLGGSPRTVPGESQERRRITSTFYRTSCVGGGAPRQHSCPWRKILAASRSLATSAGSLMRRAVLPASAAHLAPLPARDALPRLRRRLALLTAMTAAMASATTWRQHCSPKILRRPSRQVLLPLVESSSASSTSD